MMREEISDRAIALAKAHSQSAVTPEHLLVAILERPGVEPDEWELWLERAQLRVAIPGTSLGTPELSSEAAKLLSQCSTTSGAWELADQLIQSLRQDWAEEANGGRSTQQEATSTQARESATTSEQIDAESPDEAPLDIDEVLAKFDSLVGMQEVKNQIIQLMHLHQLNHRREEEGLSAVPVGLHLVFTGNPGTGKTTVARLVADLYRTLGLLPRGHLVEVQRADLVGGYVGQTAIKVQQKVESAMGGILFIDEAYSLATESDIDYGSEAVSTLVKMMEDHRDKLSVIVAGYQREMEYFISSNTGLRSRFQRYISFRDYEPVELFGIFELQCTQYNIELTSEVRDCLIQLFNNLPNEQRNGNGRLARNLFEIMYARMASRVGEDGIITQDELNEGFSVEDIPDLELPEDKKIGFYL